jgi:2-keto-4-pentenoate hydratase/2-oxohepta-3-ene-1,7-dioic acid hydratase in catechol pathway
VGGFAVANDLTLRERVIKSIALGKLFDTHTPLGPWIVTADELPDPHSLALKTWVNGILRQSGDTSDMIGQCYELIEEISAVCTLHPGDVLLTGTPAGSGIFCTPPRSLRTQDRIRIEIECIGTIDNCVVDEPLVTAGLSGKKNWLAPR